MKMTRNENDEWPENTPIGTFSICENGIEGYPEATGHIQFLCPNKKHCSVLLGSNFVPRPDKSKCNIWAWDGNLENPTIIPSINCVTIDEEGKPTGRCGWHGFITKGEIK